MKRTQILTTLFAVFIFAGLLIGASKESRPASSAFGRVDTTTPVPVKKYQVSLTQEQWGSVMSILTGARYFIGRSLTVDSADVYKNNLLLVQNEFTGQLIPQLADSVKKKGN